jgi:PIN domain nuclease of toxin-antitoxin system
LILLLDANALIWWLSDDETLAAGARAAITDGDNDVLVSAATVWELAIKRAKGRIRLDADLTSAIEGAGFSSLPVSSGDAEHAAGLPAHHQDPFDRMLVAQAERLGAVVVTRDAAFAAYGVEVIRA